MTSVRPPESRYSDGRDISCTIGWPRGLRHRGSHRSVLADITAHGSSKFCLLRVERSMFSMNDLRRGQRIPLEQAIELLPFHRPFLITSVQPTLPRLASQTA